MAGSKRVTKASVPAAERAQRGQKLVKKAMALGNKGNKTRALLMASARRLLDANSPLGLSAAAISKEAGTSPPTFYVYFENVEDILWALCEEISQDVSHLFDDEAFLRVDDRLEDDALAFVRGYCAIWAEHGPLLLYRNMEADRGNKRFNQLVLRIALPILEGITERIVEADVGSQPVSRVDANAEAVVLVSAIDRIAAALHLWPDESLMPEVLLRAEARVLTRMLRR
ncbi:TetR/AcrR family transcriptional regulator [Novosphingobium sp. JCM 18896]|uniref:TetR/AcrR family transcriptional regulator n=1 Tax=Novosphingobium sp. JCM 18896 TaxID=2989731 RepID=UPI0022223E61|nr:TetR/AcrR family transcriptional regulator [Novosphingobium sp. JCM 18896]MCW1429532.1 TetR/AcrR family transcriptional regulator [Novosphingobium sp. JCM 18896]